MSEDRNSRALGFGMSAALAHVLRALVDSDVLSEQQVLSALQAAADSCRKKASLHKSDILHGAAGHVDELRAAFREARVPT
jgi:hypothetical protein